MIQIADKKASDTTLREAFAMAAMQGMLANPAGQQTLGEVQVGAIQMADLMIHGLNQEPRT